MKFYDLLQLSTKDLKTRIKDASCSDKKRYWKALIIKDVLCVFFAIFFIVFFNKIFGEKNSSVAVVIFCVLLGIRFVDFDYKLSTSIVNLLITFLIIILGPYLNSILNPELAFFINFFFLMTILIMTCEQPMYGNSSLYVFGYILLFSSPVYGFDMFLRVLEMLVGFVVCALVLYKKHRHKEYRKSFKDILRAFSIGDDKCKWQIKLALGISLGILIGSLLKLERIMWAAIAIMSVLTPYYDTPHSRIKDRVLGVVVGSIAFLVIYNIVPNSYISLMGPLSGLVLGFCASYRWSSIFNCFGALLVASSVYGGSQATFLRIFNNLFGCLFALVFYFIFNKFYEKISNYFVC